MRKSCPKSWYQTSDEKIVIWRRLTQLLKLCSDSATNRNLQAVSIRLHEAKRCERQLERAAVADALNK